MANSVKASCGHYVVAVGQEGSIARKRCENGVCLACKDAAYDANVATEADKRKYLADLI